MPVPTNAITIRGTDLWLGKDQTASKVWIPNAYIIKIIIPNKLSAHISLDKIKTSKIFNWLKNNGISDKEMLKTFNCGVGFCIIVESKNLKKISKFFSKEYKPYVIGKISKGKSKVKLNGSINWYQ